MGASGDWMAFETLDPKSNTALWGCNSQATSVPFHACPVPGTALALEIQRETQSATFRTDIPGTTGHSTPALGAQMLTSGDVTVGPKSGPTLSIFLFKKSLPVVK